MRALMRWLPYRTSSRLAAVFGLTALAVALTSAGVIRTVIPEHPRNQLSEDLAAALIAVTPSDPGAVAALAARLGMSVLILDGAQVLASADNTLDPGALRAAMAAQPQARTLQLREASGAPVFALRDGARLAALGHFTTELSARGRVTLAAGLALVLALLVVAFLATQRIARPLTPITQGLRRIGGGDLAARVPVEGSGELRTLASDVNEMAAALERAGAAKREMMLAIGHEFSSPIARILFQAERIPDPELRARITANLTRISLLFRTLLSAETAREAPWQGSALPFPDVIEEIAEAQADPRLQLDLPAVRMIVQCDPMRLDLMVSNLLANALRHAPEGPVLLRARHTGERLVISLRDHGPGLAPELLARVGEPFLRADPARRFDASQPGGMGLGLYLCSRIAEAAGGRLRLSTPAGGGLEAVLELPCIAERPPGGASQIHPDTSRAPKLQG